MQDITLNRIEAVAMIATSMVSNIGFPLTLVVAINEIAPSIIGASMAFNPLIVKFLVIVGAITVARRLADYTIQSFFLGKALFNTPERLNYSPLAHNIKRLFV